MEQYYVNALMVLVWFVLWYFFYVNGTKQQTLPVDPGLIRYSSLTLVSVSGFYTVLHLSDVRSSNDLYFYCGIVLLFFGALLTYFSRRAMSNITAKEVLFSINTKPSFSGLYAYFHHPMYLGILLILTGSFVLIPNPYALSFFPVLIFSLYKKSCIEHAAHGNAS